MLSDNSDNWTRCYSLTGVGNKEIIRFPIDTERGTCIINRMNRRYQQYDTISESSSDMNELSAIAYQKKKMLAESIKIGWW